MASTTTAPSLSSRLFSVLDEGKAIDWEKNRVCSALLIRAIYNVIRCDDLLKKVHVKELRRSKHKVIVNSLRKATGSDQELESHPQWQLWTVSCIISDTQHRIAAAFERSIVYWTLEFGHVETEDPRANRSERQNLENLANPWIGSRLLYLRFILLFAAEVVSKHAKQRKQTGKLRELYEDAASVMSRHNKAMKTYADTSAAAFAIRGAQDALYKLVSSGRIREYLAASDIVSGVRPTGKKALTDEQCLAIVIGRVNQFKHRITSPVSPDEFRRRSERYQRHIELAITIQALRAVICFYKAMVVCIENAPIEKHRGGKSNRRSGRGAPHSASSRARRDS